MMTTENSVKAILTISVLAASVLLGVTGCNGGRNQTNIELIQDMMDQRSDKSQDYDDVRQEPSNRTPPEGTVPRGFKPYPYPTDALAAEAKLVNPYANDSSEKFMARGKDRFNTYCAVCHGDSGAGDGNVAKYLAVKPPPLISDKVKAFKDGRIFHIITAGQGVMNTYATQITKESDRWAIVNYVRTLQKKK